MWNVYDTLSKSNLLGNDKGKDVGFMCYLYIEELAGCMLQCIGLA